MQPKDLVEGASHWVELIRGKVVAPANPTVRSSSGGRVIDFVVIDQRLGHAVHSIVADEDFPASPHRALVLKLRGHRNEDLVRVSLRPRGFGVDLPVGCAQPPREEMQPSALPPGHDVNLLDDGAKFVSGRFEQLMTIAEGQACITTP